MKRFSIILLGALAIMMAGCSKDVHTASKEPVSDDWQVNLDLPVPIEFGSGSVQTKAPINSINDLLTYVDENGTLHNKSIGVYAIDKNASTIVKEDLLLDNHRAYYIENEDGTKELSLMQKESQGINHDPQYYPIVSEKSYDFYGYYARTADENIAEISDETKILVNVSVGSHKDDILWAKATTGENSDGYHARYIRKNPDKKPTLNFKHVTSCLRFRAIYAPTYDDEGNITSEMESIYISSIKFKNLHQTAQLCVLDVVNPANASKLTVTGDPVPLDAQRDVVLETKNNIVADELFDLDADGKRVYKPTPLCDDFFIAPQDEVLEAEFVINYKPKGGKEVSQKVTYKLDPASLGARMNEDGKVVDEEGNVIRLFEAGYWYGFNIKVYSPEKISINVSLSDYNTAFGTTDGYNENNENEDNNLIFG